MMLAKKEYESLKVIEKAFEMFGDEQAVAFTGGKDSLVVLHMVRTFSGGSTVSIPALNIDTSVEFKEIYEFIGFISSEWKLKLIVIKNTEVLKDLKIAGDKEQCCRLLKVEPLNSAIERHNLKAVMTGLRWDEQEARADEAYFSKRQNPGHTRVNPLLHFTEADVWDYIKKHKLPYCRLYDYGYRSLGCMPCTEKSKDGGERQGRAKEKEEKMRALRQLGYF